MRSLKHWQSKVFKSPPSRGVLVASMSSRATLSGARSPALLLITQDIMAPDAAIGMRDAALAGLGRIDILVNCAEGSHPLPLDASEETWEESDRAQHCFRG